MDPMERRTRAMTTGTWIFVAIVHPEIGAECGNNNLWSHRWSVDGWPEFNDSPWTTNDARAGGGKHTRAGLHDTAALGSDNGCGSGINEIGVSVTNSDTRSDSRISTTGLEAPASGTGD